MKVKEQLNNAVFLDQKTYDRLSKDLPKQLMVTVAGIADKYKVNGSIARKVIRDMREKGLIHRVSTHHAWFTVYKGKDAKVPTGEEEAVAETTTKKGKK